MLEFALLELLCTYLLIFKIRRLHDILNNFKDIRSRQVYIIFCKEMKNVENKHIINSISRKRQKRS